MIAPRGFVQKDLSCLNKSPRPQSTNISCKPFWPFPSDDAHSCDTSEICRLPCRFPRQSGLASARSEEAAQNGLPNYSCNVPTIRPLYLRGPSFCRHTRRSLSWRARTLYWMACTFDDFSTRSHPSIAAPVARIPHPNDLPQPHGKTSDLAQIA